LALDPLELATIVGILVVFFLWGPQKIPELARMIGRAKKEFDTASREFQSAALSIQDGTNPLFAPNTPNANPAKPLPGVRTAFPPQAAPAPAAPPKTGDQLLIETARRVGITTQGKTREQIQEEIIAMAQRPIPGDSAPEPSKTETPTG
jgi:sec-independent protein translocase protein TatA